MWLVHYKILLVAGGVALFAAIVLHKWHEESDLLGLLAFGSFAILTFASDSVTTYTDAGSPYTVNGVLSVQLFFAALALLGLIIAVLDATDRWPEKTAKRGSD